MMFDDNWWYLIIFDDICIHIFIYVCIDYLLGFAFLTIGVDNFKSAPCVLKLKDLHFAGVHGIIIQLLATALTLKIVTLKHYVTTSFFQRHASFFRDFDLKLTVMRLLSYQGQPEQLPSWCRSCFSWMNWPFSHPRATGPWSNRSLCKWKQAQNFPSAEQSGSVNW